MSFPSPEELWARTFAVENAWRDRFADVPFEDRGGSHPSRYYQDLAVDRVTRRPLPTAFSVLLTLATGTGKTFIAFQIAWKLFHSRWNLSRKPTRRPRILFSPTGTSSQTVSATPSRRFPGMREAHRSRRHSKKGKVPKNGSIFFTIFQTFMCGPVVNGEPSPYFGDYLPDFFDFIVIDERPPGRCS
ncbi:MAG: DEAD/DEAH box helicase family protein [Fimbriimonadales bacterium]